MHRIPCGVARLPKKSTAKCAQVYTFFKTDLGDLVGTLPGQYLERVNRALAVSLGLAT